MRCLFLMLLCFGVSVKTIAYSPSCGSGGDESFIFVESLEGVKEVVFDCLSMCGSYNSKNNRDYVHFNAVSGDKISFDVEYSIGIEVDQNENCLPVDRGKLIRFIGERKGGVLTIYPSRELVENVTYLSFSKVKINLPSGIDTSVIP